MLFYLDRRFICGSVSSVASPSSAIFVCQSEGVFDFGRVRFDYGFPLLHSWQKSRGYSFEQQPHLR